jgi:hypothetical protein
MMDWLEAIIAAACLVCFIIAGSYIILWAFP